MKIEDRWVELVDTGGIGLVDTQALEEHVEAQIQQAMAVADVLVLVTDAREGCTPIDEEIARLLRVCDVPIVLAVNKTESKKARDAVSEFARLGLDPVRVSALERVGLDYLGSLITEALPEGDWTEEMEDPVLKLAIIGRVNVGKSTFLNHLAGEERAIVSEIPGTTRDAVDLRVEKDGRVILVTDTAGLKREASVQDSVEIGSKYSTRTMPGSGSQSRLGHNS